MTNVLVTGSTGQLGSELHHLVFQQKFEGQFFFITRRDIDLLDIEDIQRYIQLHQINIIINCAAYTGVDKAESDGDLARDINVCAVKNLALIAQQNSLKLIHISTDYVFDGTKCCPYTESDRCNPQGVYGQTKYAGERELLSLNPKNSIIIRTSWVYSSFGHNFVKTMLRLGKEKKLLNVVYDQVGTPTYARDIAIAILNIIPKLINDGVSVYHFSNEGVTSWYDFAKEIMDISDLSCEIMPILSKEYPTPAKRPHFSVLSKEKIKKSFNLVIPHWKDSLEECLNLLL